MEWLENIGFSAAGLPWWGGFILMLLTFGATKGIDGYLKWRKATFEERQYDDVQTKEGYAALVEELKEQVKGLKADMATVLSELKESRAEQAKSKDAHAKCEVGQAELRGELNVMKVRLEALERHDHNNIENNKQLKAKAEAAQATAIAAVEQVAQVAEVVKQHREPT